MVRVLPHHKKTTPQSKNLFFIYYLYETSTWINPRVVRTIVCAMDEDSVNDVIRVSLRVFSLKSIRSIESLQKYNIV
jgi:hypothetical protein